MAKRPSQSQADDASGGTSAPQRARRSSATKPIPPGAPVPSNTQAAQARATEEQPIDLNPGPRPEALDNLEAHEHPETSTPESTSMASEPSEQDIRMRAYHRYLERGGSPGNDFEDWVQAEKELKDRR